MTFPWQKMTVEDFAKFEGLLGQRIVTAGGTHWSRVRPLFYRPLLPFQEFQPGSVKPPVTALLGGFQHAVPPGEKANSFLNLLMFENAQAYSLESLDYQRRRQVKLAAKQFTIRPVADISEFKQEAYVAYLSFYERTRYRYGSQRTKRDSFFRWADTLFQIPQLVALGAYRNGRLGGVSLSLLLGETLYYAIFFCDTESLLSQLAGLMLHFLRQTVAESKCARQIFVGFYKNENGKGVDDFYLQRGCKLIRKPALLQLNPLARQLLKRFLPRQYAQLKGEITDSRASSNAGLDRPTREPGRQAVSEQSMAVAMHKVPAA